MGDDVIAIFEATVKALQGDPSVKDLREIREQLDSHILWANMKDLLRRLNDQDRIAELRDAAARCRRAAQDLSAKQLDRRDVVRIVAIGGGVALGAGAIAGVMALAAPGVALIPLIGAGFIVWRGITSSRAVSEEITLLDNIADRIQELLAD